MGTWNEKNYAPPIAPSAPYREPALSRKRMNPSIKRLRNIFTWSKQPQLPSIQTYTQEETPNSVLQTWVANLTSLKQQATILTAMRGPDGFPKECGAKDVCRYLRSISLNCAPDCNNEKFMVPQISVDIALRDFVNNYEQYPFHFVTHLMCAYEVVGYKHPNNEIRTRCRDFYYAMCKSMHLKPESEADLDKRQEF